LQRQAQVRPYGEPDFITPLNPSHAYPASRQARRQAGLTKRGIGKETDSGSDFPRFAKEGE